LAGSSSAQSELRPTSRRVESFSDAVFAIVVTIMVFEIRIPDDLAFGGDRAALAGLAAVLVTYALSFFVVVNLWTSHHYLLFTVPSPARSTIWYNNLLLFCVSLIPVVTRFLGMHPDSARAAAAYGFVGVACTGAFMLLRSHAARISHNPPHRTVPGDLRDIRPARLRQAVAGLDMLRDRAADVRPSGHPGPSDAQPRGGRAACARAVLPVSLSIRVTAFINLTGREPERSGRPSKQRRSK